MAVGGALFGRTGPGSKALVEFRAGKMNLVGILVTPDKRKGLVMVEQGEDHLMHLKWKDRTTGKVEDDLIIFPDDIEFKRVTQCTTGRVYVLKFKSSSQKRFFWMQEPKEDKDEEFCKKVNDYLNNPPAPGSSARVSGGSSAGSALAAAGIPGLDLSNFGDSELQSLLNNVNQQQLMQLLRGASGGSALQSHLIQSPSGSSSSSSSSTRQRTSLRAATGTAPTPIASAASAASAKSPAASTVAAAAATTAAPAAGSSAATAKPGPIQLSDLQSILSGIQVPPGAGAASGSAEDPAIANVDLAAGLTTDVLQPLLENPDFVRKMKDLLPKQEGLPQADSAAEIRGTIQSAQFKQALAMFSSGFHTGQLAPLIREFQLGDEAVSAAMAGDMEAFVKALQSRSAQDSSSKATPKEDEGMDLD